MNKDQEFFTVKQVAKMLDVSETTILRRVQNSEIPTHRVGRLIKISKADFDAYLKRIRESEYEAWPKAEDKELQLTRKLKWHRGAGRVRRLLHKAGLPPDIDMEQLTRQIVDAVMDAATGPAYRDSSRSGTRKKRK